jgi:hypothetical protein
MLYTALVQWGADSIDPRPVIALFASVYGYEQFPSQMHCQCQIDVHNGTLEHNEMALLTIVKELT